MQKCTTAPGPTGTSPSAGWQPSLKPVESEYFTPVPVALELPLIQTKDEFGIPFLNTTAVHVNAIVAEAVR
jgi:hypothetical protein